ncbi:MAG: RNA 2',3'-cyclic phosphodiesterase [Clostridiales bacterium]|nr:RNA 2',3'-cyclic phosphodiesterase [Clostridiales bacterium]
MASYYHKGVINIRLFIAINFPDGVLDKISGIIEKARENSTSGRFVDRQNLHLTLEFLGKVEPGRLFAIKKIMDGIEQPLFKMRLAGIGRFKRPEGDIYWIGVVDNPALFDLQRRLHEALEAEGFPLEQKKYTPHITIGRKVRLKEGFSICSELDGMAVHVKKVDLMRSELTKKRAIYTVLYSKPLEERRKE